MITSFLEQKVFDEEQMVTVRYIRSVLQISRRELASLTGLDGATIKRAETGNGRLRHPTAVHLVEVLNAELHKHGALSEDKTLQLKHVAMLVS
jgi:transcriptional regulator with XRE-family HTH domain